MLRRAALAATHLARPPSSASAQPSHAAAAAPTEVVESAARFLPATSVECLSPLPILRCRTPPLFADAAHAPLRGFSSSADGWDEDGGSVVVPRASDDLASSSSAVNVNKAAGIRGNADRGGSSRLAGGGGGPNLQLNFLASSKTTLLHYRRRCSPCQQSPSTPHLLLRRSFSISSEEEDSDYSAAPALPSKAVASTILCNQCRRRDLTLNKKLRLKPWKMALMLHRYDKGARDRQDIDGDFRHVLKPKLHEIHEYIHASTSKGGEHRFSKKNIKAASMEIIRHKELAFANEAMQAMKERDITFEPLDQGKPERFLGIFGRLMAQEFRDGRISKTYTAARRLAEKRTPET